MERKRRRWWTWGLSTVAALVVLAATLSLVFRLVVDAVPDYRDKLQNLVAQAAGHPTRIGSMALTWQRLQPSLDLRDVALLDAQGKPLLQVSRLRLGFSLGRLLTANWIPGTIEVYGLQLEADVDDLGHWSMRGFSGGGGDKLSDEEIERIAQLDRVRLRDGRLVVHDPQLSRQTLTVGVADADVRRDGQRYTLSARLQPPPELATAASASAVLQGNPARPETLQGSGALQLTDIQGWPWLAGSLGPGVRLTLQQAQLHLSGRVEAGRLTELDAQAGVSAVAAVRGKDILARVTQLQLDVAAWPEPQAWRTEVRKLAMNGARGPAAAQGHFRYAVTEQGSSLDAGADGLRLDDLAPWLALWKDLPPGAARLRDVRGDVHDLALHYEQAAAADATSAAAAGRYSLRARLAGAGLAADATQPGFSGLDGLVEADQDGGHLKLQQAALQVQLPDAFERPLPVASLSGDFGWKRGDAAAPGWRIGAPQFEWKLLGTSGHGQFSLLLPAQAEASPNLQLSADFAAEDVTVLKPWIPKDWGAGTRDWLTRALQHARVPQAHLQLDGPLADYPYVEKTTGHWLLDLTVADGTLAYAPGWPPAEKLQAQLRFRGHGLQISSSGAQIAGNAVDHIESQIPDFRQAQLTVDGSTHSDAARYYALLRNSPLSKKLASLLAATDAAGPAAVDVHLQIPLNVDDPPVHVMGTARFDGGTLKVRGIDPPVTALRGRLAFDDNGVSSDGLSGQLYGSTLNATIRAEPESPDGVLLVQTDAPVQAADGLFAAYTPDWLRQRLGGTAHIAARLPFAGPHSGQLSLSSDLRGVAARLPQPVTKSAADSMPLTVTVGDGATAKTSDADALRVRIEVADRLGVALRFGKAAKGPADALSTRSVEVRLGPGSMPRADADGVFVSGAPAVLEVPAWMDLLDAIDGSGDQAAAKPAPPGAGSSLALRGFDLTPQQLVYRGATLQQAHLLGTPNADGWSVQLDGANAQGVIAFNRSGGGHLQARLQRLYLQPLADMSAPQEDAANVAKAPPFDPTQAPLLDLACDSLKVGAADLGRFSLLTARTAGGQTLDPLKLEGGQLQANTRGTWLRRNGSSYADLSFEFDARDLGSVLEAFGYAKTMDGKKARFSGTLTWPQNPDGLELAQARGKVSLAVEKGVLLAVKPGAGRVLGLVNLYALPRRLLTLDFHDVVSTGLVFDTLGGDFALADGQAQTGNLKVDASSMKMQMSGRIGLAARDYDQKITIYPNVTTGVTVGATLLGGPIAGGIALLAQEVFNKPFNALSQFSYRVTGSWDNPQVKVGEVKEIPKTAAPTPAAEPAPEPQAQPAPQNGE